MLHVHILCALCVFFLLYYLKNLVHNILVYNYINNYNRLLLIFNDVIIFPSHTMGVLIQHVVCSLLLVKLLTPSSMALIALYPATHLLLTPAPHRNTSYSSLTWAVTWYGGNIWAQPQNLPLFACNPNKNSS